MPTWFVQFRNTEKPLTDLGHKAIHSNKLKSPNQIWLPAFLALFWSLQLNIYRIFNFGGSCNCRHGKLFTQRPGQNKRTLIKIQYVLNKSPAACIQYERAMPAICQKLLQVYIMINVWLLKLNLSIPGRFAKLKQMTGYLIGQKT